jgi:hypothetical protein
LNQRRIPAEPTPIRRILPWRHDTNSPGTIVSDVTKNAGRVRFVLQGASAAGTSALRTVLLWRESASAAPGAPADIVVRRGLVDTIARPGSNGFLPTDILADAPQRMTDAAASGGNANAHRAIVRGGFIGLGYDMTLDMLGADPEKTAVPSANYNLYFTHSTDDGRAGSWSSAIDLSHVQSPTLTVVEPRLVPTPGTIVNPLTGAPDAGDKQNPNVLYIAYATERNTPAGESGRVYVSRSTDQGASFEPFVPVSAGVAGESESQLRPLPDGSSTMVLWMGETSPGDAAAGRHRRAECLQGAGLELPMHPSRARGGSEPPRVRHRGCGRRGELHAQRQREQRRHGRERGGQRQFRDDSRHGAGGRGTAARAGHRPDPRRQIRAADARWPEVNRRSIRCCRC